MDEYIKREAAIKNIKEHQCRNCSDIGLFENCAVLTAIKLFEDVHAADVQPVKWIPVTERLPDMHVEVLVCTEDYGETKLGFATVAVFDGSGWLETWERKTYLTAITHWMPLPEPPKEET